VVTPHGDVEFNGSLLVSATDIEWRATTSGGPGGQHANRTLSRVVVTLDVERAASLPEAFREALLSQGLYVLRASSSAERSQHQNRHAALRTLATRLDRALTPAPTRKPTKPSRAQRERRLVAKQHQAARKRNRRVRDD
jgi:ribosome-associated protein